MSENLIFTWTMEAIEFIIFKIFIDILLRDKNISSKVATQYWFFVNWICFYFGYIIKLKGLRENRLYNHCDTNMPFHPWLIHARYREITLKYLLRYLLAIKSQKKPNYFGVGIMNVYLLQIDALSLKKKKKYLIKCNLHSCACR